MSKNKSEINVNGEMFQMIERKCRGCEKVFKVGPNSKQKYHSLACESFVGHDVPGFNFWFGTDGNPVIPSSGIIEPDED